MGTDGYTAIKEAEGNKTAIIIRIEKILDCLIIL